MWTKCRSSFHVTRGRLALRYVGATNAVPHVGNAARLLQICVSLPPNSKLCWTCERATTAYKCDACKTSLPSTCFDAEVLHLAQVHTRKRVCFNCQALGYSPKDVKPYECMGKHKRGHLKFGSQLLRDVKREHSSLLVCEEARPAVYLMNSPTQCWRASRCWVLGPKPFPRFSLRELRVPEVS